MRHLLILTLLMALHPSAMATKDSETVPEMQPQALPAPPWQYTHNADALEMISIELLESEPSSATDDRLWFMDHLYPAETYHGGGINEAIRSDYPPDFLSLAIEVGGEPYHLYQIIYGPESKIGSYGSPPNQVGVVLHPRILLSVGYETADINWAIDLSSWALASGNLVSQSVVRQSARWAEEHNGVLYVSNWHRTYAESSQGLNGYITALDLTDMSILWRSDPLVCNSENFLIIGDTIVSGYGFTDEPDYIYLISRLTGEVYDRFQVSTAPEYMVYEHGCLYLLCYDTQYVFQVIL
jgi:hypothetical protein